MGHEAQPLLAISRQTRISADLQETLHFALLPLKI
jgi:hypothetical protein